MKKQIEIRWHGRGGQGAKTASLLLAEAAFDTGAYVQGFPEYGPERMGAPITAYNRISDKPIHVHCNIYEPDVVAVIDETLLASVDVAGGVREDGVVIVNSRKSPEELRPLMPNYKGRICAVDASRIAQETIGGNFPNTPMLAAVVKASGLIDENTFFEGMKKSFAHKFAAKPEVVEGNLAAVRRGYTEVRS